MTLNMNMMVMFSGPQWDLHCWLVKAERCFHLFPDFRQHPIFPLSVALEKYSWLYLYDTVRGIPWLGVSISSRAFSEIFIFWLSVALEKYSCPYLSKIYDPPTFLIFTQSIDSLYDSFNDILGTSCRYFGDIIGTYGSTLGPLWDHSLSYFPSLSFCRSVPPEFLRSFFCLFVCY